MSKLIFLTILSVLAASLSGCSRASQQETRSEENRQGDSLISLNLQGWSSTTHSTGDHLWVESRNPAGDCRVDLDRWRGLPPRAGGPMSVASRRPVTVAGQEQELLTTSMFQGSPEVVEVVFLRSSQFYARVVFRGCPPATVNEVLSGVSFAWAGH